MDGEGRSAGCHNTSTTAKVVTTKFDSNYGTFLMAIAEGGRELQTELDRMNGPLASRSRSPGRESTQRLCTCFCNVLRENGQTEGFWSDHLDTFK